MRHGVEDAHRDAGYTREVWAKGGMLGKEVGTWMWRGTEGGGVGRGEV